MTAPNAQPRSDSTAAGVVMNTDYRERQSCRELCEHDSLRYRRIWSTAHLGSLDEFAPRRRASAPTVRSAGRWPTPSRRRGRATTPDRWSAATSAATRFPPRPGHRPHGRLHTGGAAHAAAAAASPSLQRWPTRCWRRTRSSSPPGHPPRRLGPRHPVPAADLRRGARRGLATVVEAEPTLAAVVPAMASLVPEAERQRAQARELAAGRRAVGAASGSPAAVADRGSAPTRGGGLSPRRCPPQRGRGGNIMTDITPTSRSAHR